MMRRMRQASLLVALYMLTSATTGFAECAWVMWHASESTTYRHGWRFVTTFASREQCVQDLTGRASNFKDGGWGVLLDDAKLTLWAKEVGMMRMMCLPDNLDPRGYFARVWNLLIGLQWP